MGLELLEWLATRTLPEEARLADTAYAAEVARAFVSGLGRATGRRRRSCSARTSPAAQEALFAEAERLGPAHHERARRLGPQPACDELRRHARGRLRAEPRPRRALARPRAAALRGHAALLACRAPRRCSRCAARSLGEGRRPAVHEPRQREPGRDPGRAPSCSRWSRDYLDTYERFGLRRPQRSVLRPRRPRHRQRADAPGRRRTRASRTARRATRSWRAASSR